MDEGLLALLIPILAIVLGSLVVLIPIAGLTARFALKPMLDALARYREMQGEGQRVAMLEQRLALIEEQQHGQERALARLTEEAEFRRQLDAPPAS